MLTLFQHRVASALITPLIAGTVLGILAPFNTDDFSLSIRFMYWIGLTLAGGIGAMAASFALAKFRPAASALSRTLIQSFAATVAVAPFVLSLHIRSSVYGVLVILFYIWVIAIVITTFGALAGRKADTAPPNDTRPTLLDRLPPKFRNAALYAISSEDHYVRIHSEAGEHMLLMRLTDAEDLAAPLSGLKPHRSWWVAEAGVDTVTKIDGKLRIRLKSGADVPVSREGAKRVREANWL